MSKLSSPKRSPLSRQWPIFGVMVTATLFASFHQIGLATISSEIGEALHLNSAQLGSLAAIFAIAYACMQIPAGLLADTVGCRKSVTAALIVAACGTIVFASSTSFFQAIIGRIFIGLGVAVISVPLIKLTVEWFKPQQFAKMTAYAFTIQSMGFLLATSPVALISAAIGWRMTYFTLAFITLISATSIWLVVRDKPDFGDCPASDTPDESTANKGSLDKDATDSDTTSNGTTENSATKNSTDPNGKEAHRTSPKGVNPNLLSSNNGVAWSSVSRTCTTEKRDSGPSCSEKSEPVPPKLSIKETLLTTLKQKQLWVLGGWYALQGGIFFSFIGIWAGQYLTQGYGFSVQEAGLVLMIPACAIMTSPLFVALANRIGSQRKVIIGLSCATVLLTLPLPFPLPQMPSPLLPTYFFILASSTMGGVAIIFTMGKNVLPPAYAGTATGLINIFPFMGGAVLQQLIGALIELQSSTPDLTVFTRTFTLFPLLAVGSVILALCTKAQEPPLSHQPHIIHPPRH